MSGIIQTNASRVLTFAAAHGFTAGTMPFPVNFQDDANVPAVASNALNGRHDAIALVDTTTTIRIFSTEVEWIVTGVKTTFSASEGDCLFVQDGGGLGLSPGTISDPVFIISGDDTILYVGNGSGLISSIGVPISGKPYEMIHVHGQTPASQNGWYIFDPLGGNFVQISTDTGGVQLLDASFTAQEASNHLLSYYDARLSTALPGRTIVQYTWDFVLTSQGGATVQIVANAADAPAAWTITDSRGAGSLLDAADISGTADNFSITHSGANWWGDIDVSLTIEDDQGDTDTET